MRAAWEEFLDRGQAAQAAVNALGAGTKIGRMGNQSTRVHGYRFDSKLEADRYRELVQLRTAGLIAVLLRQVPFDVAPGVVYRVDFLIVWNRTGLPDHVVTYEDCKGFLTDTARVKIRTVEDRHHVRIRIVKRHEVSR